MEDEDDENLTIKQRFKKLENRVSKIQQQISDAETVNETNKKMLNNMEKK
jgi:ribulose 1,5-bisphosphate carboxylase large subunit-like protein